MLSQNGFVQAIKAFINDKGFGALKN